MNTTVFSLSISSRICSCAAFMNLNASKATIGARSSLAATRSCQSSKSAIRDGERDGGQLMVCSPGHYDHEVTRGFRHGDLPQGKLVGRAD
jgi:hypothetical protein